MKFSKNNTSSYFLFLFILTLTGGILFIYPDFISYPTIGFKGLLYKLFHWGLNCLPLFFLLYFLSINKYVFAFTFPILTAIGATIGFYSYFYKATLTPMIVDATLNNDIGTSLDVISLFQIILFIITIALSVIIVIYRFKHIVVDKKHIHIIICIGLAVVLYSANERVTNSFYQHYPTSLYYNLNEYRKLYEKRNLPRINPDPTINYISNEELTIVFIIGESLRADHMGINGYIRNTTPLLAKQKNIISLKNIYTEYTYTNPSVAHILTRADSINTERANTEHSFITLFKSCGFHTSWLANQDAAVTYYPFMMECDTLIYARPEKSVYTYSDWHDSDLFPLFDKIENLQAENKLIILHTIGSHWYYNSHYPDEFKVYSPVTKSKIISQNTSEEIINSYDNSVLYTDYFINNIIDRLKDKNAILIYLSDHGESLGEDGNWLHASDNKYLRNPASIVWYSDIYYTKNKQKIDKLYERREKRYRTDFLYHTILSAAVIPTKVIDESLNLFSEK